MTSHDKAAVAAVRQLEWQAYRQKWHKYAQSIVGVYTVTENGTSEVYLDLDGKTIGVRFGSLDAAQEAAREHFNSTVLSALDPAFLESGE